MRRPCPLVDDPPVASYERQTVWARCFALVYDPFLWLAERAGMARERRGLLREARGRVLEIGAGTGLNVPHYPAGLDELILTEPDAAMCRRLVRRANGATVAAAPADDLPAEDASVDTVVSTLVLCTVDDPMAALREIRRVLRPDGQLLLIEHVRSDTRWGARLQRLLRTPWSRFARGCRCDQPTADLLRAAGFELDLRRARWRGMPPIVGPVVVGRGYAGT
jgi:SAM-dependent methyltransferase